MHETTSFKRMGDGADLNNFENEESVRLKGKGTAHTRCDQTIQ